LIVWSDVGSWVITQSPLLAIHAKYTGIDRRREFHVVSNDKNLGDIVAVSLSYHRRQGNSSAVNENIALAAIFLPVGGVLNTFTVI
jgi:hypothetical protein